MFAVLPSSVMALGFGFNKAKLLSSAEKFVQQGKLQNAIAEYDKIIKQDPKDLTVLNTVGDLYARLGSGDKAAEYFRKVGDAYAANGFVVKAIAMYKKLTKLPSPSTDALVRLAELYTQQGLYNDARAQYMSIADQYLKNNERERATGILKKMLELDPENAAMQTKVADLYLKLGNQKEALDIYFKSAEALYHRGSVDQAQDALNRLAKLDQNYAPALLLRGQIAAETGDAQAAVQNLSRIGDIDSRPDALRPLLQAYLKLHDFAHAEPIATKLLKVHNDFAGLSSFAEALMVAGEQERALAIYDEYADKFLSGNHDKLMEALSASVAKVKDSAPGLQSMLALMQKTGAEAHALREVQELLAHAYVQAGQLQEAANLYSELSRSEPENPLHEQNYKQIIARLGQDSATRELSEEEAGQAFMADELEAPPAIAQEYTRELTEEIQSALTDSELFSSYNVPEKAAGPLERVLPKAPNDIRLRQRLASLYVRVQRYAEAAECCAVLADVHAKAGLADQAAHFKELADRYKAQAPAVPRQPEQPAPVAAPVPEAAPPPAASEITPALAVSAGAETPAPAAEGSIAEFDLTAIPLEAAQTEPAPQAEPPAQEFQVQPAPRADDASEWEEMLTVEAPAEPAQATPPEQPQVSDEETPDEVVEEAKFYISQQMHAEAQSAIRRLQRMAPGHPALDELIAAAAASAEASAEPEVKPEAATEEIPAAEQKAAEPEAPAAKPAEPVVRAAPAPIPVQAPQSPTSEPELVLEAPAEPSLDEAAPLEDLMPEIATGEPASFTAAPTQIPPAVPATAPAMSASAAADPLAGLVSDVEDALGDLALPAGEAPKTVKAPPPHPAPPVTPPQPKVAVAAASNGNSAMEAEATSMLSDLLDEFKEEIEEPAGEQEDPETHYNLGVAFREMGLLDEAIGELQKVCRAVDSGASFSQPIQAYTWLAQCLVEKGAPQAAIRWYERALHVSGISDESRLAVYYDMATAFEAAGNRKAALDNFMEVYGANIDYRDVAERIRGLRA